MSERACRGCRRHLSAFLDGELSARRKRLVRHHLDGCEHCRGRLEELRQVARQTSLLGAPPPEDLEAGILRRLEEGLRERTEPSRSPWRSPLLVGASAVVLAAVVGLGVIGLRELSPFDGPRRARETVSPPAGPAPSTSPLDESRSHAEERVEGEAAEPVEPPEAPGPRNEAGRSRAGPGPDAPVSPAGREDEAAKLGSGAELAPSRRDGLEKGRTETEPRMQRTVGGAEQAPAETEKEEALPSRQADAEGPPAPAGPIEEKRPQAGFTDFREKSGKKGPGAAEAYSGTDRSAPASGCDGPPVAEPGPGEVLGCPGVSGGHPVRILLGAAGDRETRGLGGGDSQQGDVAETPSRTLADLDASQTQAEKDEGTPLSAPPELLPLPVPVPAAAALTPLELLIELRLAPDGRVLTVSAVPPAEEGSVEAAVCAAVARWRFRPDEGPGAGTERSLRLSLRLEPAAR